MKWNSSNVIGLRDMKWNEMELIKGIIGLRDMKWNEMELIKRNRITGHEME